MKKKILVTGNPAVGKTSLLKSAFTDDLFDENIQTTMSVEYSSYNNPFEDYKAVGKINLWDLTTYSKNLQTITDYIDSTDVIILVYDTTNQESLTDLPNYAQKVQAYNSRISKSVVTTVQKLHQVMLVGTKADLEKHSQVNDDDIEQVKQEIASTIHIDPANINPLKVSAKQKEAYDGIESFKNELKRQIHRIGTIDSIDHMSDESKSDYSDDYSYNNRNSACCICICYLIKGFLIWNLLGCIGAALGTITGAIDKYNIFQGSGFHVSDHLGPLSLKEFSTLQQGTIIGAFSGLSGSVGILLIYLLYKKLCTNQSERAENYNQIPKEHRYSCS